MCVNLEASHFGNSAPLELLVPVEKPEAVAEMGDCIFDPIVTAIAISQSHFPNCGRVSNCLGPCASLLSPSAIILYVMLCVVICKNFVNGLWYCIFLCF
jgi:hypothetical protein